MTDHLFAIVIETWVEQSPCAKLGDTLVLEAEVEVVETQAKILIRSCMCFCPVA